MRKAIGIVLAIVFVIIGIYFGIIPALLGAAAAGWSLKYFGVVGANSALVSETKGVKIAKYVLLAVILIIIAVVAYSILSQ